MDLYPKIYKEHLQFNKIKENHPIKKTGKRFKLTLNKKDTNGR